ncbi:MAG: hypothetical protein R3D97_17190 [Paracoccaceae bacterium]
MRFPVLAALLCGALALPQLANAADVQVPVNKDFLEGERGIQGYGDSYYFRWDVLLIDGVVHLCGAGKFPDARTAHAIKGTMYKAKLTYRGKTILKDISFFTRLKKNDDLLKANATCRSTGVVPVKNGGDFVLDWPGGRIRF